MSVPGIGGWGEVSKVYGPGRQQMLNKFTLTQILLTHLLPTTSFPDPPEIPEFTTHKKKLGSIMAQRR